MLTWAGKPHLHKAYGFNLASDFISVGHLGVFVLDYFVKLEL